MLKKIYFINNCFSDEKIKNYEKYFIKQKENIEYLKKITFNKIYKKPLIKKYNNKIKVKSNISKNKFKSIVLKAKKYIKNGDIFQVVLSQRFETKLTKRPIEIYKKLRINIPSPFM